MGLFDKTQYGYWGTDGKNNLSYGLLMFLSIAGGFLALDHLYLRSPVSFVVKIILNLATFGLWWLYDVLQVVFNKDSVKLFGYTIPGYGPAGIGAGMLAGDKPGAKHSAFLIYALSLIFGGMFGMDSFVVGDKGIGLIRILLLISVIFTPIAIIWHLFNLGKFFFKTESVIDEHADYFGRPGPDMPILSSLSKIPIIGTLINFLKTPLAFLGDPIAGAVNNLTSAIQDTTSIITGAEAVTAETLKVGEKFAETGAKIAETVEEAEAALTGLPAIGTALTAATSGVSVEGLQKAVNLAQKGGAGGTTNDMLSYALFGTVGFIAVSGLLVSFRRFRQNGQRDGKIKDDSPPKPRDV